MSFPRAFVIFLAAAGFLSGPPLRAQSLTRIAATSLTLPATPPTSGYTTERTLNNLEFDQPLAIVSAPGETNRLFVVEKPGRILVVSNLSSGRPTKSVFLDLANSVDASGEGGLLALAFHPDYASNGYFYVWSTRFAITNAGAGFHDRLSRFRVSPGNANVADAASEQPLITQFDEASNHNGGEIKFGPDGYLYLSLGDEGGGGDGFENGQRIDRDFFSSILRLDVDQRPGSLAPTAHPAVHAGTYRIPPDNPFVGASSFNGVALNPSSVRTEIWAIGLRNPFRMSFDSLTGRLWVADVGQGAREEIDLVTRGGNYGWPFREGFIAYAGTPPAQASLVDPVHDYSHEDGLAVTGGIVYREPTIAPLAGAYLFSDFVSGTVWALRYNGTGPAAVEILTTNPGIAGFGLNPLNRDVLLANLFEGSVRRLIYDPAQNGTPFPATLSASGVFSSVATLTPAPGVVAYEPNVSFWSDHAQKRRWFALPDSSSNFGYDATNNWTLPEGAVWVKHFDLELVRGDPATARRIETRILVKTAGGVYGLSYRWNDAQTDATLVDEVGGNADFNVVEDGVSRTQTWRFPSRAECLACHTAQGGFALSFNTRQLNRTQDYPGGTANQLTALAQAGYLNSTPPDPASLPTLVAASDTTKPLEARARSYLDANCVQCHQPGGTALGTWDARFNTPLVSANILNGALVDNGGDNANRVIVPGDATHSRLFHRLSATAGATRMPPLATHERDQAAEQLILDWIADLAAKFPASITLSNLGQTYDGIPKSVAATTNPAGLTVNLTYSGSAAAPTNAGTYSVFASIDDPAYEGSASGTLTIAKANLIARAEDKTREHGAENPPLTIAYAGFVQGETISMLDSLPSVSTTATTDSDAGLYPLPITGGADDNYDFSRVAGTLTVVRSGQSIAFGALSDRPYGTVAFNLSAAASSGLPVSFTVLSGPATISGNTVALLGTGSIIVRASQPGDVNHEAAPNVDRAFNVTKAVLTITADSPTRSYGAANPALTYTITGYLNDDNSSVLVGIPDVTTSATATSPVGIYPVTLALGNLTATNYTFNFRNGALAVVPAALSAKADDKFKLQGTANPPLTITYTGFVNGETASVLDREPDIATTAVADSPRGTYPITLIGGTDDNYALTRFDGTLIVTSTNVAPTITSPPSDRNVRAYQDAVFTVAATGVPAPNIQWQRKRAGDLDWLDLADGAGIAGAQSPILTLVGVTAANSGDIFRAIADNGEIPVATSDPAALIVEKSDQALTFDPLPGAAYGAAPFEIFAAASSNLPVICTVVDGPATILGNTVTIGGAGTVTIRASQPGSENYHAAPGIECTFNVAPATLAVTAIDDRRSHGAPNPVFRAAFSGFVNGDTIEVLSGAPGLNTTATIDSPAGVYPITAGTGALVAANYVFTFVDGLLTIVPAITTTPSGIVAAPPGAPAILRVTATAGTPTTFQWQILQSTQAPTSRSTPTTIEEWLDIPGAVQPEFTIQSVQRFNAGTYRVVVTANGVSTASEPIRVVLDAVAPSAARLLNLSTRALSQPDAGVLIPGFVVQGSGTKRLLIRAVGPSLNDPPINFGGAVIPDPRLVLKRWNPALPPNGGYVDVEANDDWNNNANAADIVAAAAQLFAFPLTRAKDAALLVDVTAGQYSVIADDKTGISGIAIVEVYDADIAAVNARLTNVSNRGFAGIGDQVMIPGFVVSPDGAKTLLVRVVGPTLGGPPYNVPGVMADPKLTVHRMGGDGNDTLILTQDNWSENPDAPHTEQIAQQVFAFPLEQNSADAAFVVTLPPGVYTVIGTSAVPNGTGVVLVEVYEVP